MVINHLEKLFVTSDAATILREMDIMHPAAKMIVMAAQQQEREVCFPSIFLSIALHPFPRLSPLLFHPLTLYSSVSLCSDPL